MKGLGLTLYRHGTVELVLCDSSKCEFKGFSIITSYEKKVKGHLQRL